MRDMSKLPAIKKAAGGGELARKRYRLEENQHYHVGASEDSPLYNDLLRGEISNAG